MRRISSSVVGSINTVTARTVLQIILYSSARKICELCGVSPKKKSQRLVAASKCHGFWILLNGHPSSSLQSVAVQRTRASVLKLAMHLQCVHIAAMAYFSSIFACLHVRNARMPSSLALSATGSGGGDKPPPCLERPCR